MKKTKFMYLIFQLSFKIDIFNTVKFVFQFEMSKRNAEEERVQFLTNAILTQFLAQIGVAFQFAHFNSN